MKTQNTLQLLVLLLTQLCFAQVGIKVETPLTNFHVNGNVQITEEIRLGGSKTTLGNPGIRGQVLKSNGNNMPASWVTLAVPEVPATSAGSLIAVNGEMQIGEEITALLTSDFETTTTNNDPLIIRTLNVKLIDTHNNLSNGRFKVKEDGIYLITINAQLSFVYHGTSEEDILKPFVGLWDDKYSKWVTRVNDTFENRHRTLGTQCYTLITAVKLKQDNWYSFRMANPSKGSGYMIRMAAQSDGNSGSGPISFFSIKRLN
ncbi:hypothetical protein [Myroides odoratus]|uniref:hypothetical protein n=1 Tax=Myroides odoratus TaxID=256 RepID=UPI00333F1EB4